MFNSHLLIPFDDQCQRVLEILAIQKVVMPINDLLWRVKPYTQEQLQFALDRIVEDGYADPSVWTSGGGNREIMYKINLRGLRFHADGGYQGETHKKLQMPPVLTNEEKLNEILRAYVELGVGKGAFAYEMAKGLRQEIPAEEVVMLARHLEGDGYLDWIQLTRTTRKGDVVTKEKLTSKDYFTANIKGRMYFEKGGYNKDAPTTPTVVQQTHNYIFSGPGVVDHSSGRRGDNKAQSTPQEKPERERWVIRAITSVWGWIRSWWFMIVGPALLAMLLQVPSVKRQVLDVLHLNDSDSTEEPIFRDSTNVK